MPQRIQRKRAKGWRKPAGAVVVSRPSRWGNTWKVGSIIDDLGPRYYGRRYAYIDARLATEIFRRWALQDGPLDHDPRQFREAVRAELAGHDLVCWCPLDQPCHADVLRQLANS
jgi:hypothetical protein